MGGEKKEISKKEPDDKSYSTITHHNISINNRKTWLGEGRGGGTVVDQKHGAG